MNNILIQKMLLRNESYTPLQKYYLWEILRDLGNKYDTNNNI